MRVQSVGMQNQISAAYALARDRYAEFGVDTEAAIARLATIPISVHCWQGDDLGGFETPGAQLSGGGLAATGNYPGKHRFNLHASYLDHGGKFVDRDHVEPRHFQSWIDWAKALGIGLDFNPTF